MTIESIKINARVYCQHDFRPFFVSVSLVLPANCAIIVFTVLFAPSVGFSCGVYGAVNRCLVPISVRKLLKILQANCNPLSNMTTLGTPYLAIMRYLKAFFRDSAVALCSGTNSLYMENRSFSTSSIWLPCFERGRGPTKSAHTLAHGSVGFCVSILFGLNLMHVSHPRTWARASLCIPDLNNTGLPDVLL